MTYDLIVAGGGLTGAAAAYGCAVGGGKVLLLERRGISGRPEEVALVQADMGGILPPGSLAIRAVERLALVQGGMREEYPWSGFLVRRGLLRREFLAAAQDLGAELWLGCREICLGPEEGLVRVQTHEGGREVQGQFILGADGAFSRVGQSLNLRNRRFLATAWRQAPAGKSLSIPEIHRGAGFPGGWAWVYPWEGEAWAGVAVEGRPKDSLEFFLVALGAKFRTRAATPTHTGIVPSGGSLAMTGEGRVLLAGDAAGTAFWNRTAFGMGSGFLAGELAAAKGLGDGYRERLAEMGAFDPMPFENLADGKS